MLDSSARQASPFIALLLSILLQLGCRGYAPSGSADGTMPPDASSIADAATFDAQAPDASAGEVDATVGPPTFLVTGGGVIEDVAEAITVDSDGNVFLAGYFQSNASFDGFSISSEGLHDGFVAKYSRHGELLWMQTVSGVDNQSLHSIALDSQENVLVCGRATGATTINGSQVLVTEQGRHGVVIALSNAGDFLWSVVVGGPGDSDFRRLAIDSSDAVHVTGSFGNHIELAGNALWSEGSSDILVARIASGGQVSWVTSAGGADYDVGIGIDAGPQGDTWVTGLFNDQASFDATSLHSHGMNDAFVARYGADGALRWVSYGGGVDWDAGFQVAVGDNEESVMVGYITYDATFAGTFIEAAGWEDVLIAAYAPNGALRWVKRAGNATADARANDVVLDAVGNAYVTGYVMGLSSDFGNHVINSNGWEDIFLALIDRDGEFLAARSVGGDDWDMGRGLHMHTDGVLFVAGFFKNTAQFDGAAATSHGSFDAFGWGTVFP